jgi:hypothetical protein
MKDYTALVRQLDAALHEMQRKGQLLRQKPPREIEIWKREARHELTPRVPPAARAGLSRSDLPTVIELPRYCAIYDGEMCLARYGLEEGGYKFKTSIELTPQQKHRYTADNAITLPDSFETDAERCACCGAWSLDGCSGAVWCDQHNGGRGARVCYGNTSPGGFFRCCVSCGASGQLGDGEPDRHGLVPGRRGNHAR